MEPQQPPPPPPASPFDPAARPKTGGCPKPLIIGCLAVLLIGGLALLGGFFYIAKNASRVLQWSLTTMEKGVMAQLPRDVTPEEKDRLKQAFADVTAGLKAGRITPEQFQPVQSNIMEIARKGSNVTRQDVLELTEALEKVAGKAGGPPQSGTAPP